MQISIDVDAETITYYKHPDSRLDSNPILRIINN